MTLVDKVQKDLVAAMKAKDALRTAFRREFDLLFFDQRDQVGNGYRALGGQAVNGDEFRIDFGLRRRGKDARLPEEQ